MTVACQARIEDPTSSWTSDCWDVYNQPVHTFLKEASQMHSDNNYFSTADEMLSCDEPYRCDTKANVKVRSLSFGAASSIRKKKKTKEEVDVRRVHFADSVGLSLVQVQPDDRECRKRSKSLSLDDGLSIPLDPFEVKKSLFPMFEQPGSLSNFLELVRQRKVCLEYAFLDSDNLSIKGYVRVLNMDYHKSVYVRWSLDDWKTMFDYRISYIDDSSDSETDRFQFKIYAPLNVGQTVELAVRFHCHGEQFWDNNGGANYKLTCMATEQEVERRKEGSSVRRLYGDL